MPLFGNYDDVRISEAEVPPAIGKGTGQRIRVGVVERDNGLTTATTSTISNALYDLADQNSTTHTVLLPHGTTVKLGASVTPTVGSWRAKFVITNPKLDKTVEAKGSSAAADMANQIDLLALGQIDKDALAKVTEAYNAGSEHAMLVAFGLAEEKLEPLREDQIHVSGYVTQSGRHVGAYGQIRKTLDKLETGDTAHFPEGITAKRSNSGFSISGGDVLSKHTNSGAAADAVAIGSLNSDHPKSLGGKQEQSQAFGAAIQGNVSDRIDNLPADNPKLPGTPHPEAVADRAAAARKSAKLPSRKERAANEKAARPGSTTPSGLPLPPPATKHTTTGGPGQISDPSLATHKSDASFGDVSKKTLEGWSDRTLGREIDANPGRTAADSGKLKAMQSEYRRRKTASAHSRGFIGG